MRYRTRALLLLALAASCDDKGAPPDLSRVDDLASPPADLTTSADLLRPRCLSPAPYAYLEVINYNWSSPGGPLTQTTSFANVAVRGDGTFARLGDPISSPDRFTCTFTEVDVDPLTCTAPCCPATARQPQPLAPTVYVDEKGWSSWMSGSCSYFVGNAPYNAAVIRIATQPPH